MKVTFEGTIHEVLDQIEDFCKSVIKESTPEVKVVFEPPCPTHEKPAPTNPDGIVIQAPDDLTAACMSIVNGDKAKKAALMAILAEYDCNTVKAIHVNDQAAFWARVKDL